MNAKKVEFTLDYGPGWRVFVLAFADPYWDENKRGFSMFERSGPWSWCAYAEFNKDHELFDKGESFWHEYMHRGCTYSRVRTISELSEYEKTYGNNKTVDMVINKVGMDFQHLDDDFYGFDPADGIPLYIRNYAENLISVIKGA